MPLIVGATPYSPWQSLKPLLQHLGWQDQTIDLAPDASSVGAAHLSNLDADSREKGCYLLLHTRPELAIAQAMDEGKDPDTALNEWRTAAEQLLAFYKQNRHHAAVVEITSACEQPRRLTEWLAQNHPAFQYLDQNSEAEEVVDPAIESGSLNLLLATQWVTQQDSLAPLLAQLEAASIPLLDEGYRPPAIDVAALYRHKEENELLLDQLHRVQEELEKYHLKLKDSEGLQELPAQLEQVENQKEELKEENGQLREQMSQVKEEVERRYLKAKDSDKLKELQAELEQLQSKNQELQNTVDDLTATNEQSEAEQNELKEENELILKQLFQVQEELERYYIKNQELIAETNRQKEQITTKNEKLRRFGQEYKDLKRKNKELDDLLERSQEVIKELKKSNTRNSPIKALTQSFRKASRSNRLLEEQIRLVEESDLFDAEWYLLHNPDVAAKYPNPAEHFVRHGGQEGRAPGPNFSSKAYLSKYPDVAESGQNPLVHYLQHGKQEGRKP